ncbi:MAG: hypothetical protein ACYS9Y_14270 [Planctomycetota bacterium]
MSPREVMTLAGHSRFDTTNKFYLTVTGDLLERARSTMAKVAHGCHTEQFPEKTG